MPNPPATTPHRVRMILVSAIIASLIAVILVQQSRIRHLREGIAESQNPGGKPEVRSRSTSGDPPAAPSTLRKDHRTEDPLARTRKGQLEDVEKQLQEISAPLDEDMASTMFHAEIKEGQSLVTGGYQTADGMNQFTILKPSIVREPNGHETIQIDSKIIAVSPQDTEQSGLNSLATNAKNTLQHAESWEEADVSSTMEKIGTSASSAYLGEPSVIVEPGQNFSIQMTSDGSSSYTLTGTAQLSPTGSGVVLKARIEQKNAQAVKSSDPR